MVHQSFASYMALIYRQMMDLPSRGAGTTTLPMVLYPIGYGNQNLKY